MSKHLRLHAAFDRGSLSPWLTLLSGLLLILVALHAIAQAPAATAATARWTTWSAALPCTPTIWSRSSCRHRPARCRSCRPTASWTSARPTPSCRSTTSGTTPSRRLLNYPEVVKMMSNDLDWTSALGEAVVADQGAVLEGVQSFRRRAQAAGNLKSDDKQVVKAEKEIIIIEPANPAGDLCAAIHPEHGDRLWRGAGLRLLPGTLSVVLLPLCTGSRACHGPDLGRGHRRGLERRPLGCRLQRRRHQHRHRPQYQHRSR